MAWFILARIGFILAVAYSAYMLEPFSSEPAVNIGVAVGLAALAVGFEWQLHNTAVTQMLGAFLGGAVGLVLAKGIRRPCSADHGAAKVAFSSSSAGLPHWG
jgi:glycerol uptake facilitator-like aquaporin